jgi:hypothetical protein
MSRSHQDAIFSGHNPHSPIPPLANPTFFLSPISHPHQGGPLSASHSAVFLYFHFLLSFSLAFFILSSPLPSLPFFLAFRNAL